MVGNAVARHWRPVADMPLVVTPDCPVDGVTLAVVGQAGSVRVGGCPSCGHVTYIDKPTPAWVTSYYETEWARKRKSTKVSTTVEQILALDIPVTTPILDIGCGEGQDVRALRSRGYTHVTGVDPSQGTVLESLQDAYELVYGAHVLEHVYDLHGFLRGIRKLQKPGDWLLLTVPDQDKEPVLSIMAFLPHLHSFTKHSLRKLGALCGYQLVFCKDGVKGEFLTLFVLNPTVAVPEVTVSLDFITSRLSAVTSEMVFVK